MSVCTIHLVRHGEHDLPPGTLAGRLPGVALSGAGRSQARSLGARLAGTGIRAVLSSPQIRTRQTADAIAEACHAPLAIEPGLDEIDFGTWQGQKFAALEADPAWRHWNAVRGLAATPAADSMVSVQARALNTLARAASGGGTVAAVTHCDVIRAVLCAILGTPLDLLHRIEIGLASRSVILLGPGFARVDGVNLQP